MSYFSIYIDTAFPPSPDTTYTLPINFSFSSSKTYEVSATASFITNVEWPLHSLDIDFFFNSSTEFGSVDIGKVLCPLSFEKDSTTTSYRMHSGYGSSSFSFPGIEYDGSNIRFRIRNKYVDGSYSPPLPLFTGKIRISFTEINL